MTKTRWTLFFVAALAGPSMIFVTGAAAQAPISTPVMGKEKPGQIAEMGMGKAMPAPMPGMGMSKEMPAPMPGTGMGKEMPAPMPGTGMGKEMPAPMPGMGMMDSGKMRMMAECPMMGEDMETHTEGRIAFLKAELAITDVQKAAWDGYAAVLAKNLQAMQRTRQTMIKTIGAKSPVERLDSHLSAMESRIGALKEVKPALGALYSALIDDQKKKADQLLTGMGCMM